MGARTSAWCAALAASAIAVPAAAGPDDWTLTEHQVAIAVFDQRGRGFQSQAGAIGEPGEEDAVIFHPHLRFAIAQNEDITHEVVLSADVVSAASPDAVDVVSQASKWQEAGSAAVQTTARVGDDHLVAARAGVAGEENLASVFAGGELQRELADDNATITVGADLIFDYFSDYRRDGRLLPDRATRVTAGGYVSVSQLLSPTAIVWASYGVTLQAGDLATSFNTAPIALGGRYKERFPGTRLRHAVSVELARHAPSARATVRGKYRYYRDDFDISAHTGELQVYKYLGARLLARVSGRVHRQTAAAFFAQAFPRGMPTDAPRTSDSDLDAFWAGEVGAKLSYSFGPRRYLASGLTVDLSWFRYVRSNGMTIDVAALGYSKRW